MGIPTFVAGVGTSHEDYLYWIGLGAQGLQVGSRFALCRDSGMDPDTRDQIIAGNIAGTNVLETSCSDSPTGYPIKRLNLARTLSESEVRKYRHKICNLGYLRADHRVTQEDGTVRTTYICPAMPRKQYLALGGVPTDETDQCVCLCNALLATVGLNPNPNEPAYVTLGAEGLLVTKLLTARQVMEDILTPEVVADLERHVLLRAA